MAIKRIDCPQCHSTSFEFMSDGRMECRSCGTIFGSPREEILCRTCGTINPSVAKRCMNCGANLLRVCAICGHHNPSGLDHCLECGQPLDTLSSVAMRTTSGVEEFRRRQIDDLVHTKGKDAVYLAQERTRLEAEEQDRVKVASDQRALILRRQRLIMGIAAFIALSTIAALIVAILILGG
jgi:ribosomal protein S27E